MSSFDLRQDAPGLLRAESLNITLKFERTGATTGRVSWNVPAPAAGCTAENQAYYGMLVTIDTTPASSNKIPTNGTMYESDATADSNLFAGSTIGTAMVVGAFYEDRTTTFFDVTGLKPNTPYYVSGFPVDAQHRYFIEGVHAYSLDFKNRGTDGTSGTNVVILNQPNGVLATDYTGLAPTVEYDFTLQLGAVPPATHPYNPTEYNPTSQQYTVQVNGTYAQTYADLVRAINKQFALLTNPAQGPVAPNTGTYYWSNTQTKLFQWDGSQHVEVAVLIGDTLPDSVVVGTLWVHPTTGVLQRWDGATWSTVTYHTYDTDPTMPVADGSYWFDGTYVSIWNGNTWCRVTTLAQSVNPSLPVLPAAGAYWYDSVNGGLYKWNATLEMWDAATAIQYHEDPNALTPGAYWLNESNNRLYAYNGPSMGWTEISNLTIAELTPTPVAGRFWYNPIDQALSVRNSANTEWISLPVIAFPSDPTVRSNCGLWWNTDTDILSVWDTIHTTWVAVSQFFQQAVDPSLAPTVADGTAWLNTTTQQLSVWSNTCFTPVAYITNATDPTSTIIDGAVWYSATTDTWKVRQAGLWVAVEPITSPNDPRNLPIGTFWFNPSNLGLQQWNGISWVYVTYSAVPLTPALRTLWFDTTIDTLKEWTADGWTPAQLIVTVELDRNGNLLFTDTSIGSLSYVHITGGTLFTSLSAQVNSYVPTQGTDGASDEPSYNELGIGTDGSIAIRAALANDMRYDLGYPVVDVELTPEQIDHAISLALEQFRARSGMAYERGFFFMPLKANEQKYKLTNKTTDMNKIVDVLGVYRMSGSFLSTAHGAGVYGQIVLQHMYNMGTFDLLSFHIMSEYTKLLEMLFAARITYQWNEQKRELFINHRFAMNEKLVCIEATTERTEQDLMTDRYARAWIRRWALAQCRMMLAETRGKFSTLPGAGGGVSLNASDLRQQAKEDFELCIADIDDYVMDGPDGYGMGASFTFG